MYSEVHLRNFTDDAKKKLRDQRKFILYLGYYLGKL